MHYMQRDRAGAACLSQRQRSARRGGSDSLAVPKETETMGADVLSCAIVTIALILLLISVIVLVSRRARQAAADQDDTA